MAYRDRLAAPLALLSASLLSLAACGFGDDERGQPLEPEVDAPPVDASPVDAPPTPRVFEVILNPPTAIPDNNATGVAIPITVTGVTATTGLDVQVAVAHTYSGDLVIELRRATPRPRASRSCAAAPAAPAKTSKRPTASRPPSWARRSMMSTPFTLAIAPGSTLAPSAW